MNTLSIVGKYLDQPRLVGKFSKTVPALLVAGGAAFAYKHLKSTPEQNRKKELIKSVAVLSGTIGSALVATRGLGRIKLSKELTEKLLQGKLNKKLNKGIKNVLNKIGIKKNELGELVLFKGFEGLSEKLDFKELADSNTKLIKDFLQNNEVSEKTAQILEKAKKKVLNFSEVKTIFNELNDKKAGKEFLRELIPDPENIDSKHIFGEIKRLSVMGLVPVLGGIAGGIAGDRLTEEDWKAKIPNKIKEGSYQYLANIFLCNIGAGAALAALEKAKITSKSARALGMIGGILAFGVLGGSAIANFIGKKIIDPVIESKHIRSFGHRHHNCYQNGKCQVLKDMYSERTPEPLDLGLHVDDVATVAVLSGLKWIEPALPILYSISGYRAGIGYRNGQKGGLVDLSPVIRPEHQTPQIFKQLAG